MQKTDLLPGIIKVNSKKCVNCHQCISVCPVKFCNDASSINEGIKNNSNLCIGCGRCIEVCTHNAREIIDDTEKFFNDLLNGEKIATLVAPAVDVNFPGNLNKLLGWFKSIGIQKNFDVSLGAEITTYQYLQEFLKNNTKPIIAQPCPCIVNYIEIYKPNLIKYLAQTGSPVMDLAKWVNYNYPSYKLAFISPCIAKKREFEDPNTDGIISYNVTIYGLKKYMKENKINLNIYENANFDGPVEAEKGILYSQPGGLLESFKKYNIPLNMNQVRKLEGEDIYTEFFDELEEELNENSCEVLLVDVLNCKHGCNLGTGILKDEITTNKALELQSKRLEKQRNEYYKSEYDDNKLQKIIENMDFIDFSRKYTDRSEAILSLEEPDEEILNVIHQQMGKENKEDIKNCSSCGYNSCDAMAKAVLNNLYRPQQCHHFIESYYKKNSGDGDFSYLSLRRLTRHRHNIIDSLAKEKLYYFINLFIKFGWLYQKKGVKINIADVIEDLFSENLTIDEISSKSFTELVDYIIDSENKNINNELATADILKDTLRKSYKLNYKIDQSLYETIKSCLENITFFDKQRRNIEEKIESEAKGFKNQIYKLTSIKGIKEIAASGIISETGDISRFETIDMFLMETGFSEDKDNINKHLNYYIILTTEQLKNENPKFIDYFNNISENNKESSYKEILNIASREVVNLIFTQLKK
ncbi:MAG: [Fe-Fe] hydrogenase large subunit C-terminal domain-containing protein [Clostridiales bacterium]